jgi:hypothetical protein
MIKKIFENIAYAYYPKGINCINDRESYLDSMEYKRLHEVISYFQDNLTKNQVYIKLTYEFENNNLLKNIRDISLLHWNERCVTFELEIIKGENLVKIILHISLLIPHYLVYTLENKIKTNPYEWITLPIRNKETEKEYSNHINTISSIVETITGFSPFPGSLANIIIPDLSIHDIELGQFTFFNAFFNDENKFE